MAEIVVLYKTPTDAAAFDKYYAETHIPLAKKLPGLKKYAISKGPVGSPAGPSGIHLVAILTFDSAADIQAAFGSPEGKATGADVPKFASGGRRARRQREKSRGRPPLARNPQPKGGGSGGEGPPPGRTAPAYSIQLS